MHHQLNSKFLSSYLGFQQMGQLPWSGYQELNRGLLLDLSFLSAPQVSHQLQYEASWRLLSCLDKSSAFAGWYL